jgi:hypothetical protein
MSEGLRRNDGKKQKNKIFPKCLLRHLGKRTYPECQSWALREEFFLNTAPSSCAVK